MTHEKASIHVVVGDLSISYEGSQEYIESGLQSLIENIINIAPESTVTTQLHSHNDQFSEQVSELQHMSTNTIASNAGAKSGPDLVICAIAHIQLVTKRDKATRSEILAEMKRATTYYKSTYNSNLSSYLDSLVKNRRINMIAENTYALAATERASMEAILVAS